MRTVVRGLDKVVVLAALLASVALVGMVGVIIVDVGKRALGMEPLVATNEIVQYMAMVLLVFLALPVTFWRGEAISAPLIFDRLSPRLQREFSVVSDLAVVVVLAGVGYYGYHEAVRQMDFGETGLISGYPLWWVRFVIPVSAVLCVVAVVGRAISRAAGERTSIHPASEEEIAAREGVL